MRIVVAGPGIEPVVRALDELKAGIRGAELLGPAALLRLRGKHRAQLVAKTDRPRQIASQAARLLAAAAPAMRRAGLPPSWTSTRSRSDLGTIPAVKGRRPEDIIGEWGVRDVTPPSQVERDQLYLDRDLNPLVGKRIRRRLRNFRAEADNYLASLGGPLPYMQRLRAIETETEQHLARLAEAYEEHRADPAAWHRSRSGGTSATSTT